MEAIVLFPAIPYFSCLSFLFFLFFCIHFFVYLWYFPIALTYERTVPTKTVWQSKEKFADTCGQVNSFFPAIAYFSSVFLFCCCLFVFTLCFNLLNCFVFLWHFQILVSSCVQFLRRRSSRAKKKLRNVWTGKIRFEPRIGAEVEIKYPKKKTNKTTTKTTTTTKTLRIQNYPDSCGRGLRVLFVNSYRNWV